MQAPIPPPTHTAPSKKMILGRIQRPTLRDAVAITTTSSAGSEILHSYGKEMLTLWMRHSSTSRKQDLILF